MFTRRLFNLVFLAFHIFTSNAQPLAFPGAEGFGRHTTGGRGGKVYVVSNLNDDGAGSFRQAATANGPRIVVFSVSGTIHLTSPLVIKKDATIAGQSAPGDGICIADHPVSLGGDNIIVRYMRFRMGDRYQNKGMVNGGGSDDAFGGMRRKNIIIDHCSISWSTDEVCTIYAGDSTTIQWSILSEPLNYSYHFETGDKDFERHGYGGIWGGSHLTAHHNLFAHCNSRTPRFNGARLGAREELVDFRNNVIYDWGENNVYGGEEGKYNIVGNYYKYGPSTKKSVKARIVNPYKTKDGIYGNFYVAGNYVDQSPEVTEDNIKGVHPEKASGNVKDSILQHKPFPVLPIATQKAKKAYKAVLRSAGASLKRDTLDKRIIDDVKDRKGGLIDVQGGFAHGTPYEKSKAAWPVLESKLSPADTDSDGMPDAWEKKQGLNALSNIDASGFALSKHYTNIEIYLNSLIK